MAGPNSRGSDDTTGLVENLNRARAGDGHNARRVSRPGQRDEAESVGIAAQMADIRQPPLVTRDCASPLSAASASRRRRVSHAVCGSMSNIRLQSGWRTNSQGRCAASDRKQQGLAARFDPERHMAGGVWPGAATAVDAGDEFVTIAIPDQIEGGPLRIGENPRDIAEIAGPHRRGRLCLRRIKPGNRDRNSRYGDARCGKQWRAGAVPEAANMIPMAMRDHHEINVVRRNPRWQRGWR